MPTKIGKPNTSSQLKTAMNMGAVPRAGAQKPGRVGEIATNNKIFSARGGAKGPGNSGPKRPKRMY